MLTSLFDIALTGIKVAQYGLEVSGNNVANVETPGYTRRGLAIKQLPNRRGATVEQVKRDINPFLAKAWQNELSPLGYYKIKDQMLNELEGIFNEIDLEGIKKALTDFWNAWEELSTDASNLSIRSSLLEKANALASRIREKKKELTEMKDFIRPDIDSVIEEVNNSIKRISELNYKIKFGKVSKQDVNNLTDERDTLLRKLSEDIGADYITNTDGQVSVFMQGQALVIESQSFALSTQLNQDGGIKIIWDGTEDITSKMLNSKRGKVAAYIEIRDQVINEYIEKLNRFAEELSTEINSQHKKGYDLNGNIGKDFFEFDPQDPSGTIRLNINDPKEIAASSDPASLPSDNRNVLSIISIRDEKLSSLDGFTIDGFYDQIISDIGNKRSINRDSLKLQEQIVQSIQDHFDSISGVNLDEEAANIIKFQYMYTASARLIDVASKITEVIINMGA